MDAMAFSSSGKTYKIKKGHHYASGIHFGHFKGTSLKMQFQFDDSAIYDLKDSTDQQDTNKLFGFTDCNVVNPTQNSARFGWRYWNNEIQIMAFVDYNGVHRFEKIGVTYPGEVSTGEIKLENGSYAFYYKGNKTMMSRHCSSKKMKGYDLFPYFGGNRTAPHEVKIWLKKN